MILENVLAFCFPIVLFGFWAILGYAVLALFQTQRNLLQNALLAPSVGLALLVISLFWFNWLGLPVMQFASGLTIALLLASVFVFCWRRPYFPGYHFLPFAGVLLFALWVTGRPLLEFGFNWLSYANDDMANYCLGALHFLHYGYFDAPNVHEFIHNQDYSHYYWVLKVVKMERHGSELLLAWAAAVTRLTPHQIFMPMIMALHLTLITVAGSLVCQSKRWRLAAWVTCGLLALSALMTLGTLYQLIAQVGGLSLLAACVLLLLQPMNFSHRSSAIRTGLLLAIVIAALMVFYIEIFPFLVISFLIYWLINLRQKKYPTTKFYLVLGTVVVAIVLLLKTYLINAALFLFKQSLVSLKSITHVQIDAFPYYRVPSGLANLWGLQALAKPLAEPWFSLSIVIGGLLLLIALSFIVWLVKRKQLVGIVSLTMCCVAVPFFLKGNGFSLFKLAMYVQPFMIGAMVVACFSLIKNVRHRYYSLAALGLLGLPAQYYYVDVSRGDRGAYAEVHQASASKLNQEFAALAATLSPVHPVILDTPHVVIAKLQSLYLRGKEAYFLSKPYFLRLAYINNKKLADKFKVTEKIYPNLMGSYQRLISNTKKIAWRESFLLHGDKTGAVSNEFTRLISTINPESQLILTAPKQSIFNRIKFDPDEQHSFKKVQWNEAENYLIFVNSDLGHDYYARNIKTVSLHRLEPDYFYKGKMMAAVGRHLLFQAVNPTPNTRFRLEITATLSGDGHNKLPMVSAIGDGRWSFPVVGRGSARVFSPPLVPQIIANFPYVAVDIGNGVEALTGKPGATGFVRDVSLISDEEYKHLEPPSSVSDFPQDLANPHLEYSGIYEDGWVAEQAFLGLKGAEHHKNLVVRGEVYKYDKMGLNTIVTLFIDGQPIWKQQLSMGNFNLQVPLPSIGTGSHRVEVRFDKVVAHLSKDDKRPAAAQLHYIGFQ